MNEACSKSNGTKSESLRFSFDRSPWNVSIANDEHTPLGFSPFQIDPKSRLQCLNFNFSPKDRHQENNDTHFWEDRVQVSLSPPDPDRKFKLKLNPLVLLKNAERTKLQSKEAREAVQEDDTWLHDGFNRYGGDDDAQKSTHFACESTVLESNMRSDRPKSRKWLNEPPEFSLLFSDSEEEDVNLGPTKSVKRNHQDLPVKKPVRMAPLCEFFIQYYNDCHNKPDFDFQTQSELEIIRSLLKHMGMKNAGALPLDPLVLRMSLFTQWKAAQRSRNLIVLVMRIAMKVTRMRFVIAQNLSSTSLIAVKRRFCQHYFSDIEDKVPGVRDMDIESHRVLARLNKDQVFAVLTAPMFEKVFTLFVEKELTFFLNGYRKRKLTRIFSKMEEVFLSYRNEEEAVRQITKWVASAKFIWVCSTSAYVTATTQARKP